MSVFRLSRMLQLSQGHREHYNDKSGTVQRVDYFVLPRKAEDQFKFDKPL